MSGIGNRPEPAETLPAGSLEAAEWLCGWLVRNADNSKAARLLELLAQRALAAARRGEQPDLVDVAILAREYTLEVGQANEDDPGKWVRSARLQEWWDARSQARDAEARRYGVAVQLQLVRRAGGGKGNQTAWGLRFEPLALQEGLDRDGEPGVDASGIRYAAEPARLALPLRWLCPPGGFSMLSWRGAALTLLIAVNVAIDLAIAWLAVVVLLGNSLSPSAAFGTAGLLAGLAWASWHFGTRPWLQLPADRLVIVPIAQLAFTQEFAQLHLVRRRLGPRPSGWLTVVRYRASCPVCGSDVDLHDGGRAFPDRIVGRCAAAPREHIYSFDPVLLEGRSLELHCALS